MTTKRSICLSLVWVGLLLASRSLAGHEVAHIPSFYPHVIELAVTDPASAAEQLKANTLQAYIGATPHFAESAPPRELGAVESLETLLVLSFNPGSKAFRQGAKRCPVAHGIAKELMEQYKDINFLPYPITPFHPDYLHHLDRIEQARARVGTAGAAKRGLKFRVQGERARAFVQSRWRLDQDAWDVSLQEVPIEQLLRAPLNAWLGPPWMKQGWFQAYQLLAPAISSPEEKRSADTAFGRLVHGQYQELAEQLNLERDLLASLTRGCERVVLGYTSRREYYNDAFSGVEHVAFDSQLGLNSPVFIRTVKLKDFPWNGELRLGMREKPEAAWNPIAGFTDSAGRLLWSTLSDTAFLSLPYNGSWIPNRVVPEVTLAADARQGFLLPSNAMLPQAGTGAWKHVGEGKFAQASIVYRVLASRFHDGTDTDVSDLLYPYVLAYRWGAKVGGDDKAYDPAIDTATVWMRERLVGLKVLRVERKVDELTEGISVLKQTPIVEVYVNSMDQDALQIAALAAPWSAVPWHVLVLMEEAVQRGLAAFSQEQAKRLGRAWMDLVRDRSLHARLRELIDEFEQKGYRPAALTDHVTVEAARLRWRALKQFADDRRHLLVTNGPYRLQRWSDTAAVVEVDRELTYPHGVTSFGHYAHPPRAVITEVRREANRVLVYADVEKIEREQRKYTTVREPMRRAAMRGLYAIRPDSRYLLLGPEGSVLRAGKARMQDDGHFEAELPAHLPGGRYTLMIAIFLDGNSIKPTARTLSFEVKAS